MRKPLCVAAWTTKDNVLFSVQMDDRGAKKKKKKPLFAFPEIRKDVIGAYDWLRCQARFVSNGPNVPKCTTGCASGRAT